MAFVDNLVVNPRADNGLNGWTHSGVDVVAGGLGNGLYCFRLSGGSSSLSQTFTPGTNAEGIKVEVCCYTPADLSREEVKVKIQVIVHQITKTSRMYVPLSSPINQMYKGAIGGNIVTWMKAVAVMPIDILEPIASIQLLVTVNDLSEYLYLDEFYLAMDEAESGGGLQENTPYYGVTIGKINGLTIERTDGSSKVKLNSDEMYWQVKIAGEMVDRLYFDAVEGDLKYNGKFGVEAIEALRADIQVLVASLLYGEKANIVELTVDSIDTNTKIRKYLDEDRSPIGYWRGQGVYLEFVDAHPKEPEETEQVKDRKGRLLYWTDNTFEYADVVETNYPVLVYKYDELVKLRIFHQLDEVTGYANPRIEFGAGNQSGYAKGYIYKDHDEFVIAYQNSQGEMREIRLGEEGIFITPFELEEINFNENGFSVKYSGETLEWGWVKDGSGRIVQLQHDGKTIPVNWG